MKRIAAVLNSEEEARQLERELIPLREQERRIQEQISAAKRDLVRYLESPPNIIGGPEKSRSHAAETDRRRTASEMNRTRAEKELLTLIPSLKAKTTRLRELRQQIEADRLQRCRTVVLEATPSDLQDVLKLRESRLNELRGQLAKVEKELHHLMTEQAITQNAEDQARVLIETGEFPSQVMGPDNSTKSKELGSQRQVLIDAIRLQEKAVNEGRRALARETANRLRPAMGEIVRRIAEGYATARTATAEADRIRNAFTQATGAEEILPCFVFAAVPTPPVDVKDQFGFWLDEMRAQGYEV